MTQVLQKRIVPVIKPQQKIDYGQYHQGYQHKHILTCMFFSLAKVTHF